MPAHRPCEDHLLPTQNRLHRGSRRPTGGRALLALAAAAMLMVPAARAAAQGLAGWTQFQGGTEHQGNAPDAPPPPYAVSWRFEIKPKNGLAASAPVLAGGRVVVAGWTAVYGIDATTGAQVWSVPREDGQPTTPAVAEVEGKRVLLYTEGDSEETSRLVAIDLRTRDLLWETPFALDAVSYSGVSVDGDTAFVGDDLGNLYAVDIATGRQLWKVELDAGVEGAIAISGGLVIAPTQNLPHDGESSSTSTTPILATLTALDESTGERAWRYVSEPNSQLVSVPMVAEGSVFLGLFDGRVQRGSLVALSAETGRQRWNTPIRTVSAFTAPTVSLTYADGLAFSADTAGGLLAVDAGTGVVRWDFQTSRPIVSSSPVVVGDRSVILVGLSDGRMVAVNVHSGHLVWERSTGSGALGGIAAGADALVIEKDGSKGGLVAFVPDPTGRLLDVRSPSEVDLAQLLGRFASAFALMTVVLLVPLRFAARRMGPAEFPWEGAEDEAESQGKDEP